MSLTRGKISIFQGDLDYAKQQIGFEFKNKQVQALQSLYMQAIILWLLYGTFVQDKCHSSGIVWYHYDAMGNRSMVVIVIAPLNSIMQDLVLILSAAIIPVCYIDIAGTRFTTHTIWASVDIQTVYIHRCGNRGAPEPLVPSLCSLFAERTSINKLALLHHSFYTM